jgi:hypothetical protein
MATAAQPAPDFRALFQTAIAWTANDDPEIPWTASLGGHALAVQLNDFPADNLSTLFVDDNPVGAFDDWPLNWQRHAR